MRSIGASSGAGQPEHDQQRGDVAEQQVLDHVRVEQFLAGAAERRQRGGDHGEAAVEARLAPTRNRVPAARESARAPGVEPAEDDERDDRRR